MTTGNLDLRVEQAVSAGGVVFRHGEAGVEFVLCGRVHENLWALPKGTPEAGETIEQTARREVTEETGLGVTIVGDLGSIEYVFARPAQGVRFEKTVHHFLMKPDGSGFRLNCRFNKFTNLPELAALWRQVLDVKNADQLNLPRPDPDDLPIDVRAGVDVVFAGRREGASQGPLADRSATREAGRYCYPSSNRAVAALAHAGRYARRHANRSFAAEGPESA